MHCCIFCIIHAHCLENNDVLCCVTFCPCVRTPQNARMWLLMGGIITGVILLILLLARVI